MKEPRRAVPKPLMLAPMTIAALLIACSEAPPPLSGTAYGEPLTLSDTTLVSDIMADPEAYVGQRVLVTGTIVEVCETRGCWMDIASDAEFEKIRIKVDDGVIVFPVSSRGEAAVVEGLVEKLEYTVEEAIELERHRAEEHGLDFDPTSITEPEVAYQIRGLGAVVLD